MSQATKKITVNGFINLGQALALAGYKGTFAAYYCKITNSNDAVLYVHLTDSANTQPTTGTDGDDIGNTAPSGTKSFLFNHSAQVLDIGTTWLFSGVTVLITVSVVGRG